MDKENGKKLLLEFAEILDEYGIPFFLIQGTALGAYRDGGFTPTEKDIDLGYLIEELASPARFVSHLIDEGYEVQTFNLPFTKPRMMTARKYGCRIDFTGYIKWKDKRFASRTFDERQLPELTIVHEAKILESSISFHLFGRKFPLFFHIEEYLRLTYGKDWETPNENHALMESTVCVRDFMKNENIPYDLLENL